MTEPPSKGRSRPPLSVLWVETSPLLAERLIRLALSRAGVAAAVATSTSDALAVLGSFAFDVVAVDVVDPTRWPDAGRLSALRSAAPLATLVALTADDEPETIQAFRALGADALVSLDGRMTALEDLLSELVRERCDERWDRASASRGSGPRRLQPLGREREEEREP